MNWTNSEVQRSAKRRGCLLSYSQAEPGRELTQPSPRLLAEPCTSGMIIPCVLVEQTWVGLKNPNLTPLNNPTASEVESAFEWIDGTAFSHSSSYSYDYNNAGVFCNKFVDNGGETFRGETCTNSKKVLCQFDCSNINSGEMICITINNLNYTK